MKIVVEHPDPDHRFRDDQVRVLSPHVIEVDFGYHLYDICCDIAQVTPECVRVSLVDFDAYHPDRDTKVFTVTADVPVLAAFQTRKRGSQVLGVLGTVLIVPAPPEEPTP
jgi:hypothetical protein